MQFPISKIISDQKYLSLKADLSLFGENQNVNSVLWKMKSKVAPKRQKAQVTAKFDLSGNIVTAPERLKSVYLKHFVQRLRHRPMRPEYEELKYLKELLCYQRLDLVKAKEFEPWTSGQLDFVLNKLKKNKSSDPYGIISELLRPELIGSDLKKTLLIILNKIKSEMIIPDLMFPVNIMTVFKGKGSQQDLMNQRGIFIINKFRDVLMKMIYHEEYDILDSNMSDSNIGGRKNKNIRNHLFIINGIINDALRKKICIDLIILDYRVCFDSLWIEEVINDLFETGVDNRNLALIYEANKVNEVSVITPSGKTETERVERIVMQGETLAPLECSVQVDTLGKECVEEDKHMFVYKKTVKVPPLSMVDDIIAVSKCGSDTVETNAFLNAKTNVKKLQYGETKCVKMHVGSDKTVCPDLNIDTWKVKSVKNHETNKYEISDEVGDKYVIKDTEKQLYLGDYLASDGTNTLNLTKRKQKGFVIINQILSMLEEGFYGKHFFKAASLLRDSLFLNSILLNTEVCYNLSLKDVRILKVVDNRLVSLNVTLEHLSVSCFLNCLLFRFVS